MAYTGLLRHTGQHNYNATSYLSYTGRLSDATNSRTESVFYAHHSSLRVTARSEARIAA